MVVVGGGLSGLAASYDLARAGFQVTLLEAAKDFGGLASSFRVEGLAVERFYHFICKGDSFLLELVREFGLEGKVHWNHARTAFHFNGQHYPFGTPFDLLRFSAVPWLGRLRFGLHVMRSKYRKDWQALDDVPAERWLIDNIGQDAYRVIWEPLLKVKFGDYCSQISAAWIWHRIWRVAVSRDSVLEPDRFACLESGTATLVEPMVEWLKKQPNVQIRNGVRVEPLVLGDGRVKSVKAGNEVFDCDAVISTAALPALDRLVPGQTSPYFERVRKVEYLGVVCMLLSLKRSFGKQFWTNISDPRVSFNGVIEQTALNRNLRDQGLNLIYIPYYLPVTAARYKATDQELYDEYVPMLRLINPEFDASWIKEWHVFRTPYAQPVFGMGFRHLMPDHRTPVGGLYVTDSTQFYPEDRTISAAIHQGRIVAGMIGEDFR